MRSLQEHTSRVKTCTYVRIIRFTHRNSLCDTIANPEITRIIEIDADNETFLSEKRINIYEAERRGIRTQTSELFKLYNSTDYGYGLYQQRSSTQSERHNNQLGSDRGTGSSKTQRIKEYIFEVEESKVSGKASRELDTTYLDAVNRGDMETAQRMVDERDTIKDKLPFITFGGKYEYLGYTL